MDENFIFLDHEIKQEINTDFETTRTVEANISDVTVGIKQEVDCETTRTVEANISDVTVGIKQEVNCEGHTVKEERQDEKEGHVSAGWESKRISSTSTCPTGDSLLGCEVYQQECTGDCHCHKCEPVTPGANIEAECDNSYAKMEIQYTDFLEVTESKHHLGSCGDEEDIYFCPLCSTGFLQLGDLHEHMKTVHSNGLLEFDNKHDDLQDVLPESSGNKMDETVNKIEDDISADAVREDNDTSADAIRQDNIKLRLTDNEHFLYSHERTAKICDNLNGNTSALKTEVCNINCRKIFSVHEKSVQSSVSDIAVATCSDLKIQSHEKLVEDKSYKCDICGELFTGKDNLQQHNRIHTGEKPFSCDVCGIIFAQRCHLQVHKIVHSRAKPYKCDFCEAAFNFNSHLNIHKRIHTGEKPYMCSVCGATFSQNSSFSRHKRTHTGEKPYKCGVCGATYTHKSSLQVHNRTHTGEKPYKCGVCGATFTYSSSLQLHTRLHTGEKPYKCDVCSATFTQNSSLQEHKRIHTGEKPYKCDVCGATFTKNSGLHEHKRIHTGQKPYKCDVCGAAFALRGNLEVHKRVHTGEKPFKCDVCGVTFTQRGNLKAHNRIHTR